MQVGVPGRLWGAASWEAGIKHTASVPGAQRSGPTPCSCVPSDSFRQESFFCPPLLAASWKRQPRLRKTRRDRVGGNTHTAVGIKAQIGDGDRVLEKGHKTGS